MIDQAVEERSGRITDQADLFNLQAMANAAGQDGYSRSQAADATRLLLKMAEQDVRVNVSQLEPILDSLAAADRRADIDAIYASYRDSLLSEPGTVITLLMHYGQLINSTPVTATKAKQDLDFRRFEEIERVASPLDVEGVALNYRVLYEHANGTDADGMKPYLTRIDSLSEKNRRLFFQALLEQTRAENWMPTTNPDSLEIQSRARSFLDSHAASLAPEEPGRELLKTASSEGLDPESGQALAALLAARETVDHSDSSDVAMTEEAAP